MRSVEATTPAEERLVERLHAYTGIRITAQNRSEILRTAGKLAAEDGASLDAWIGGLDAPGGGARLDAIVGAVTVGETHLFRGPVFRALRESVLPELVARKEREGLRMIRAASAGCSTGEEAYSLAICLREAVSDPSAWNLSVVGIDINREFLARASGGTYGRWSLRGAERELVERHFTHEGEHWTAKPELRQMVRFAYANLTEDPVRTPGVGLGGADLILCQNVLLYFDPEVRERAIEKLTGALAPEGEIFFGPSDVLQGEASWLVARRRGDVVGYLRAPNDRPLPRRRSTHPSFRAVTPPPAAVSPSPPLPAASYERAVELADRGDVEGALAELEAFLPGSAEHARAHTLHGLLLSDVGALEEALAAFRKATYLDAEALLPLAGALTAARRLGDGERASKLEARLRVLAGALPSDAPVDGWSGMRAGRLLEVLGPSARRRVGS